VIRLSWARWAAKRRLRELGRKPGGGLLLHGLGCSVGWAYWLARVG
jgi:hypothetical protein